MDKKVVVIGTGYVGLPVAIMLANSGYEVVGIDIDKNIVEAINNGEMHINEDELKELMKGDMVRKNLTAQHTPCSADVFIVAVPTPLDEKKKVADLSFVVSAIESILPHLEKGNLIIVESTIPPLTCRDVIAPLLEKTGLLVGKDVLLAHCPERILPGSIFQEIVENDRVIGGINEESSRMAKELYSSFVKGNLFVSDDVSAELTKLMENTYRDVNIALANEFNSVGETLGVDINQAITFANKHPRVNILRPGTGVGGHCIPIDPWFIKEVDPESCSLIFTARKVNDEIPYKIAAKIRRAVKDISNPKIVALGATYKANTNDLRNSPAIKIVDILTGEGYDVALHDPIAKEYAYSSIEKVAKGVDCLAILVEHEAIISELLENEQSIKALMRTPIIMRF